MFRRVLIANRGEIACRVIRSCRALAIESVAVYSEADREALHVQRADRAIPIGAAPATQSYLDAEAVIAAARAVGADAVHPGYGFLSESIAFAEACREAGLVFVGPHSEAIRRMGSKQEARRLAEELGVPVIPGYHGEDGAPEALCEAAREIGFPVMIKASAGGGGRGIRIVEREQDFADACERAAREAQSAFGDGALIVERCIPEPRHIEVQILGDRHGGLVHLFERECSVQRRHQKIVEEAPAPALDESTRARIHRFALELGRAIDYDSTGTVEFILDPSTGEIFFLEMNTRLQVEHPTTEEVTGLDLVELQLRVAAGEPLPFAQEELSCTGCAIEVRINAEDPSRGHLPRTGRIEALHWPEGEGIRVETGVRSGTEISSHYDSLLAKLIATGSDREHAIARMCNALDETLFVGPETNLELLRQVVDHADFREARLCTHFLARHFRKGPRVEDDPRLPDAAVAAALVVAGATPGPTRSPWHALGPWRLLEPAGHPAVSHVVLEPVRGSRVEARVIGREAVDLGEGPVPARVRRLSATELEIETEAGLTRARVCRANDRLALLRGGRRRSWRVVPREEAWRQRAKGSTATASALTAPFPGVVAELRCAPGDEVRAEQVLVVLEAMKMMHPLSATGSGTVGKLHCAVGDTVAGGQVLVSFAGAGEKDDGSGRRADAIDPSG